MARQEPETRERYRHFVHVAYDRATQRPVPMPLQMRTAFEKLRI